MKILMTIGTLALISGFALGDTILENGGGPTFTNMPSPLSTGLSSGIPYWNNHSGDFGGTNTGDVGYFLEASGVFSAGTNYNPNAYLSAAGNPDSPANFNMVRDTNSILMTMLGSYTGGTNTFGIYDTTNPASKTPLFTNGSAVGTTLNESAAPASYGFYVTNSGNTWYSNTALDTTDGAHQHFAIFNFAADQNVYYVGVTDWFFGNGGNGNGDYQDMVIQINSDAAVPEPATFILLGAGLLGLAYTRLRARKNWA